MTGSGPFRLRTLGLPALPRVVPPLAVAAVVLETIGLVTRLAQIPPPARHLLSMDYPGSLPRLYVSALLAGSAAIALAGAAWRPGRRLWWGGVAVAAGALSVTKALATVHKQVVDALGSGLSAWRGMVVLGFIAALGLLLLFRMSGDDRRDRRRVLAVLAAHAFAAVVLSGFSTYAGLLAGPLAGNLATFAEETGEALTAVALLGVVLAGVVPRLVLPVGSRFRRADDELPVPAVLVSPPHPHGGV